jgi:hypothetical protein
MPISTDKHNSILNRIRAEVERQRDSNLNDYEKKYYKREPTGMEVLVGIIKGLFKSIFGKAWEEFKILISKDNINSTSGGGGGDGTNGPPSKPRGINMSFKAIAAGAVLLLTLAVTPLMFGINSAGFRTVIQYPNGTLSYQFEPGLYMQWFGSTTVYNDVITFDFDKTENEEEATIDQTGIAVRYQDGGTGTVFGIARFRLPSTEVDMALLHKEFRSNDGVAYKIIKNTTEEIANHTAGLMTSEDSYAVLRGTYTEWLKTQLSKGKFGTRQKEIVTVEGGMEFCLEPDLTEAIEEECRDVKRVRKNIPVIAERGGLPIHVSDDLKQYGIELSGFNLVDWGYEEKTLKQISDKREATMAIITSKANAERAKQDAITAEQEGIKNVTVAKYQEEVIKEKAVVVAQREAEVAVISAKKQVDVAEQIKLEAEQKKLAAVQIKQEQILLGEGEAERKRLNMEADGALQVKVDAWKEVNFRYAAEFGKQKWVPEVQMGTAGAEGVSGGAAMDLINMMNVKTARDLSLDMQMKGGK